MIEKMKSVTFEQMNDKRWRDIAEQSLRGLPFDKMISGTVEGIHINPLYTKEGYEDYFKGQNKPFIKSIQTGIQTPVWTIAQEIHTQDGNTFLLGMQDALSKGNEAIVYDGTRPVDFSDSNIHSLVGPVTTYPIYCYNLGKDDPITPLFDTIPMDMRHYVTGVVTGSYVLPKGYSNLRTHCADMTALHLQGADIVTELAAGLAQIVQFGEQFPTFEELMKKVVARFSIDTNFFMEIAKLRAFRVLWHTLARAYQVDAEKIPIIAETSLRTYTVFDVHTNMLRAGNETLAAVLGGVDVFTVHPHNILGETNPQSIRSARNIQLIIREESFVKYVLDPAGGSYYIDIITKELVDAAWKMFQEIERSGGYTAYMTSGKLKEKAEETYEKRISRLSTGKRTLVGTSKYADVTEGLPEENGLIVGMRTALPFEVIRSKGIQANLKVALIRFGNLKDYKARVDFAKGYLAVGGIDAMESPVFSDVAGLDQWMAKIEFSYFILCTSLDNARIVLGDAKALQGKWMDIAGNYSEEEMNQLRDLGVSGSVYRGQDQLKKLTAIIEQATGREQN